MSLPRRASTLLATLVVGATAIASPQERQAEVQAFVEEMVAQYGFEQEALMSLMHQARFRRDIIELMERPAEAKPWYQYRRIFLTPTHIHGGVHFWRTNEAALRRAAQNYGVPPEIITAIIGVETRYGGVLGRHRVLDALTTLAFGYPKRAAFFRTELKEFLLLNREQGVVSTTSIGSYAGAMGLPQFMPSNYRTYAKDGDGDGRRDLWHSTADVIASVANYFRSHGWRSGEPIVLKARTTTPPPQAFIDAGMKPSLTLATLAKQGVTPASSSGKSLADETLASLIHLEADGGDEYWIGLNNFYVITRYNHSTLYAMAVYQLSREILALHGPT